MKPSSITITKVSQKAAETSSSFTKASKSTATTKTIDPVSFARFIEEEDEHSSEALVDLSLNALAATPGRKSDSLFGNSDEKSRDEEDYDAVSERSYGECESEYETDEGEGDAVEGRRRERRLRRTCMDDGDDEVYLKRMKRLERYERSLLRFVARLSVLLNFNWGHRNRT